jgi:hypothetical protein
MVAGFDIDKDDQHGFTVLVLAYSGAEDLRLSHQALCEKILNGDDLLNPWIVQGENLGTRCGP